MVFINERNKDQLKIYDPELARFSLKTQLKVNWGQPWKKNIR